jgi:hypothetical protein
MEIYDAILKSKKKKRIKKLILGDSCARQLYHPDNYSDSIYSLACNQAISLVGQYILFEYFLRANKSDLPDEVCLIYNPQSFNNSLDQPTTYNYFLKPFYKKENSIYFTQLCHQLVSQIPFWYLSQFPFVVNSNWSPDFHNKDKYDFYQISDISFQYILKIKNICERNHIKFKLLPSFVGKSREQLINRFKSKQENKHIFALINEFEGFFSSINYLPDSCFYDEIHLKKQFILTDYYKLRNKPNI